MKGGGRELCVVNMVERNMASRRVLLLAGSAAVLTPLAARAQPAPPLLLPPAPIPPPAFRGDQIALLMQTLADAESHGFRRDDFIPPTLDPLLRSPNAPDRLRGAVLLKSAVLAYARAQQGGRLPVSQFQKNWGMRPVPYDPEVEFTVALSQDRLSQWLETLPPPFDRYRGLKDALAQYRVIAARGGWSEIEAGPKLDLDADGPRVLALRQRLAAEDPQAGLDTTSLTFDQSLFEAVQRFQHNVGLDSTGVVDNATLAALNVPVESRILTLQANMERWRWVPRIWPATRIEANIAAQEMDAFQDNALVLEMRAAPGRPNDQTPILASQVESVVFDPPWNVPSSIAAKELWPKEAAHPGYLESHGYRIISTGDDGGRRIQQKYGPKSALGSIKFDFPNDYAVYLHDTPSHAAFGKTSRTVSHGCVRLQRPLELANLLFKGDEDWTPERIDQTIAAGKTVRAPLDAPMPIFILYWTAFLDVKGRVNFRDDVYGWDTALIGLIAAGRNRALPSTAS
jgi:murein L,D-transpeptidase YcbB/YkuD